MFVLGTRPEAIKLAPVIEATRRRPDLGAVVVVTAQHRTMLDQVLRLWGIEPDHDLDLLVPGQSLTQITSRALDGLAPILESARPDIIVVQGDTTTTFVGALAGFYQHIPVAHVEAGLRTGNRRAPYPEELNRRMTTLLADLHFAPTAAAADNLTAEGVAADSVIVTGNTVIDALRWAAEQPCTFADERLRRVTATRTGPLILVTAHRREAWGEGLRSIGRAVRRIASERPSTRIVVPLHRNPVVREALLPHLQRCPNVLVTEPLEYAPFAKLLSLTDLVITDSGGIQEEAASLGIPVLVARDATERMEAVRTGLALLVGTDEERIVSAALERLDGQDDRVHDGRPSPYGDGYASVRVVRGLARFVNSPADVGVGAAMVDVGHENSLVGEA